MTLIDGRERPQGSSLAIWPISSHLEEEVTLGATVLPTVTLHDGGAGGHPLHDLVQGAGWVVIWRETSYQRPIVADGLSWVSWLYITLHCCNLLGLDNHEMFGCLIVSYHYLHRRRDFPDFLLSWFSHSSHCNGSCFSKLQMSVKKIIIFRL